MTTHTTTSLTAFLLARLDEDEAVAKAYEHGDNWGNPYSGDGDGSDVVYGDRFDPARVLADVKAHRAIVEMAIPSGWTDEGEPVGGGYIEAWWDALRILASIYSAHPDYDESWAEALRA